MNRSLAGRIAALSIALAGSGLAFAQPALAADPDDCLVDSFGIASIDAATGDTDYACAYIASSGKISVKPLLTNKFTSGKYGMWDAKENRWDDSKYIQWSSAEACGSRTVTLYNSSGAGTHHGAVNIVWVAPAGCVPGYKNGDAVGDAYVVNSSSNGARGYFNPGFTKAQLNGAQAAKDTIMADPAYQAIYKTSDASKDLGAYCAAVGAKTVAPLSAGTPGACATLAAMPKPKAAVLASSDRIGGGVTLLDQRATMPAALSASCPSGTRLLYAEGFTFDAPDSAPSARIRQTQAGASIVADPALDGIEVGLQVQCRDAKAKLALDGTQLWGTPRGDRAGTTAKAVTAFLGFGDDSMGATGKGAVLDGGPGADTLSATGSRTVVEGGLGDDVLSASGSGHLVIGGPGKDRVTTGSGSIDVNVKDGKGGDSVRCGSSRTRVLADAGDTLSGPCTKL